MIVRDSYLHQRDMRLVSLENVIRQFRRREGRKSEAIGLRVVAFIPQDVQLVTLLSN